ncbi:hypothetical protein A4G20_06470 [Pasteurellaceae bacterium RH1A]|nr:hypothetical protein A4G20_06470 [Pasteurellaceae bacterium RH1A]
MIRDNRKMIAIWVGESHKPLEQWLKYTDGIENTRRKPPIEKDFGWFPDVDLFGIHISDNDVVIPIEDLILGATIYSEETINKVILAAKEKGIMQGNRLYYYNRSEFIPDDGNPDKLYNDLMFIGNFENPR